MTRTRTFSGLLLAFLTHSCAASNPSPPPAPDGALVLSPVAWNPSNTDVGDVAAVVEQGPAVTLFGSKGVLTLASGAVADADGTITDWRGAALIPSAGGISTWLVGLDGSGRLERIAPDQQPVDVTDPYGLGASKVLAAAGQGGVVAFLLADGLAVSDGLTVTRYADAAPRSIAVAPAKDPMPPRVAMADGAGIRVFEGGKETSIALPDASFVAYDGAGELLAATAHAVYLVKDGAASRVYDAGAGTVRQLVGAGTGMWLAIEGALARWSGGELAFARDAGLAPDARLVASPTDDVWVIAGGKLLRWSGKVAPGGDEGVWTANVEPIFASVCSQCHSPPGSGRSSSGVDLSTYAAWSARRAAIYARVVDQAGSVSAMPPPSSGVALTDAQRAAIGAWAKPAD
jgi:mono/diheme cytochrome c family protein